MRRIEPGAIGCIRRTVTWVGAGLHPLDTMSATSVATLLSTAARRTAMPSSSSAVELDAELTQLARLDRTRRLGHEIVRLLCLRKRDDVADRLLTGEEHRQPIESEGESPVRRRAGGERLEQEAELRLRLVGVDAEHREHPFLYRRLVDTDAAAADFG